MSEHGGEKAPATEREALRRIVAAIDGWMEGREEIEEVLRLTAEARLLDATEAEHVICPECFGRWGASACTHCSPPRLLCPEHGEVGGVAALRPPSTCPLANESRNRCGRPLAVTEGDDEAVHPADERYYRGHSGSPFGADR